MEFCRRVKAIDIRFAWPRRGTSLCLDEDDFKQITTLYVRIGWPMVLANCNDIDDAVGLRAGSTTELDESHLTPVLHE